MQRKIYFLIFIFLIIINFGHIQAKKGKDKKKEKKPPPEISSSKRPDFVEPGFYCNSCLKLIEIATKELHGKKTEADVFDVLSGVCKS